MEFSTVAAQLGLPREELTTWVAGRVPDPVRGLEIADERGWTAAPWNSPLGQAFNIFIAGLSAKGSFSGKDPHLVRTNGIPEEPIEEFTAVVDVLVGSHRLEQKAEVAVPLSWPIHGNPESSTRNDRRVSITE